MTLQRYIVGRPNLLKISLYPVQEDKSFHFQAGALFHYNVKELYVWCFNETYPARLDIDCQDLTPSFSIKIGDVEKMLPDGMYLHKMYHHQRFRSVVSLTQTNLYLQRKNALEDQTFAIMEQKKKITNTLMNQRKIDMGKTAKKPSVKQVPTVAQSAKFLMAEKKEAEKEAKAAEKKK